VLDMLPIAVDVAARTDRRDTELALPGAPFAPEPPPRESRVQRWFAASLHRSAQRRARLADRHDPSVQRRCLSTWPVSATQCQPDDGNLIIAFAGGPTTDHRRRRRRMQFHSAQRSPSSRSTADRFHFRAVCGHTTTRARPSQCCQSPDPSLGPSSPRDRQTARKQHQFSGSLLIDASLSAARQPPAPIEAVDRSIERGSLRLCHPFQVCGRCAARKENQ
jgi:hypothetical protein